mmetsp:Transcript_28874/g.74072  ORF Transcript_28874/g.74072 Transcript_28874/m.74072 type:complete len:455 (-) Transcript_28874:2400-3764(-)
MRSLPNTLLSLLLLASIALPFVRADDYCCDCSSAAADWSVAANGACQNGNLSCGYDKDDAKATDTCMALLVGYHIAQCLKYHRWTESEENALPTQAIGGGVVATDEQLECLYPSCDGSCRQALKSTIAAPDTEFVGSMLCALVALTALLAVIVLLFRAGVVQNPMLYPILSAFLACVTLMSMTVSGLLVGLIFSTSSSAVAKDMLDSNCVGEDSTLNTTIFYAAVLLIGAILAAALTLVMGGLSMWLIKARRDELKLEYEQRYGRGIEKDAPFAKKEKVLLYLTLSICFIELVQLSLATYGYYGPQAYFENTYLRHTFSSATSRPSGPLSNLDVEQDSCILPCCSSMGQTRTLCTSVFQDDILRCFISGSTPGSGEGTFDILSVWWVFLLAIMLLVMVAIVVVLMVLRKRGKIAIAIEPTTTGKEKIDELSSIGDKAGEGTEGGNAYRQEWKDT